MSDTRMKVGDNVEQAAQDIINYFFSYHKTLQEKAEHLAEISTLLGDLKQTYSQAYVNVFFIAWFERNFIHYFTRHRFRDIKTAIELMTEIKGDDRMMIFENIISILKQGKCESTSVNTALLRALLAKTKKYEDIDEDKRLSALGRYRYGSMMGIRVALRDVLLRKAESIIKDYYEKKQAVKVETKEVIKPSTLKINQAFKDELAAVLTGTRVRVKSSEVKKIDEYPPHKLNMSKYKELEQKLATKFQPKEQLQVKKATARKQVETKYANAISALNRIFVGAQAEDKGIKQPSLKR